MSGQVKRLKFDCELRHSIETAIATNARQLTPAIIPGGSCDPCALVGAYSLVFLLKPVKVAMAASKLLACSRSVEALGSFPKMPQLHNAASRLDCDILRSAFAASTQP